MLSSHRKSGSCLLISSRRCTGPLWLRFSWVMSAILRSRSSFLALYSSPFLMIACSRSFSAWALAISVRSMRLSLSRLYQRQPMNSRARITTPAIRTFWPSVPTPSNLGVLAARALTFSVPARRLILIIGCPRRALRPDDRDRHARADLIDHIGGDPLADLHAVERIQR